MTDRLTSALAPLLMAAMLGCLCWWGLSLGGFTLRSIEVRRDTNPAGFWVGLAFPAALALICAVAGILILLGVWKPGQ